MGNRRTRLVALALVIGGSCLAWCGAIGPAVGAPAPVVINQFVATSDADAGNGWAIDTSNPGGNGTEGFAEGPATPPDGRGSLDLTTPATANRALVFTNPGGLAPSAWNTALGATFSTFTFDTVNTLASLPTMRFAGFQNGTTGFTTLSFGANGNAAPLVGQWQTWTLTATSQVSQSNATDGFCTAAVPCTFGAFIAQYPAGAWGQVQIGLGSGAPDGAEGFADAVSVTHTATLFSYDFEVPPGANSTATVTPGAQTDTGGQVTVGLVASALAAGSVTFTVVSTLPDGSTQSQDVALTRGQQDQVTLDVPFGTTSVTVTAQGVSIASGTATFAEPPPATSEPAPPINGAFVDSGGVTTHDQTDPTVGASIAAAFAAVAAGTLLVALAYQRKRR